MTKELICDTGNEFVGSLLQRRRHKLVVHNASSRGFYGMQDRTDGVRLLIKCEDYDRDEKEILAVASCRGIPLPVNRMPRS